MKTLFFEDMLKLFQSKLVRIVLVLTGVLVGIFVTAQLKAVVPFSSSFPLDQLAVQQELIESFSDEQAVLKGQIVALREEITEMQEDLRTSARDLETLNLLKAELALTELQGAGIEIIFADSLAAKREELNVFDDVLVHAADLRDLVNLLWASGAEAIAINNQRIVSRAPINCVGNSILVDNFNLLPPFTIRAVGDPQVLLSQVAHSDGLADIYRRVEEQGLQFKFKAKAGLTLPVYNGGYQVKYLTAKGL